MAKVLVVDDDNDLLEMITFVLAKHQLEVYCTDKGSNLQDMLAKTTPDILLMDIYLGDSDGRELCKSLKGSEQHQGLPIILYSAGFISTSSIQESLADDFVSKPFDVSQLVGKIRSLLS